ncbi:CRISPR-associated endoribonuclease Cas2 (plasmid) [Leptolinea sp. HRD-7]|jgi:CRISPR-associated protein Cas2|nr:CRISPR-associated endoribonuclease Cas2 [Leptolinea sp. HRD-7]
MMVLITYDVNTETAAGKKRLAKMAKKCTNYGQRVQNSVFECVIDPALFKQVQEQLEKIMDKDHDSLRFYFLGDDWKTRVYHVGAKKSMDLEGTLIL